MRADGEGMRFQGCFKKKQNDTAQDACEVVLPPQQKCGTRIFIDTACAPSADAPEADHAYVIDSNTLALLGR